MTQMTSEQEMDKVLSFSSRLEFPQSVSGTLSHLHVVWLSREAKTY